MPHESLKDIQLNVERSLTEELIDMGKVLGTTLLQSANLPCCDERELQHVAQDMWNV